MVQPTFHSQVGTTMFSASKTHVRSALPPTQCKAPRASCKIMLARRMQSTSPAGREGLDGPLVGESNSRNGLETRPFLWFKTSHRVYVWTQVFNQHDTRWQRLSLLASLPECIFLTCSVWLRFPHVRCSVMAEMLQLRLQDRPAFIH